MPTKDLAVPIEDIDEQKGITKGYFNAFNNVDSDNDISIPGCFKKSITERGPIRGNKARIKHLFNHGTTVSVIQELEEDSYGLRYISKASSCPDGDAYMHKAKSGIITEHSFGFDVIKQQKQKDGTNHITEYLLWEGSGLDKWGANSQTPLIEAKGYNLISILADIPKYEKALRSGNIPDESYLLIQKELKHLLSIIDELRNTEPPKGTQPDVPLLVGLINSQFKLTT